ncbi:MAG: glycosyltransferase involved in cell wall biosynthesis [Motiliproteus sp.]|jgi:glycosyltransferase involved in cell wall biosynthesis
MKLVILCLSEGIGGLELYCVREYHALTRQGIQCIPVVKQGSLLDQRFIASGVVPEYLDCNFHKVPLVAAWRLGRLLKTLGADALHMHWAKDLPLAALAKKVSGRAFKLCYTRHMNISRPKKDIFHRFLYREIDALWVITEEMKREAIACIPMEATKIERLYLGVPAPETVKGETSLFDNVFTKRNLNVALFGRIEHAKGQHLLIEAVATLVGKGMDISATLVGHVMDQDYFQSQREFIRAQGLEDKIRFIGFLENPTHSMPEFEVVVLTTLKETFGLVLPEAMRSNVAVIGSNAGGVPEIIDHQQTGLLFTPGDAASLAEALLTYYNDPELRQTLASQGRDKADLQFNEGQHFQVISTKIEETVSA